MQHQGFDSSDRVQQVDWLRQEAQDILNYDMSDGQTTAAELVEFWESQGVEVPAWFDSHDRSKLVEFVEAAQG